jgi:hypothetical protein
MRQDFSSNKIRAGTLVRLLVYRSRYAMGMLPGDEQLLWEDMWRWLLRVAPRTRYISASGQIIFTTISYEATW